MAKQEIRVARSPHLEAVHYNTLDLFQGPKFAILELLDSRDSSYFRNYLLKKKWIEVTPEVPKKKKTYYWENPPADEVLEYHRIVPDWFFISGHYARTYDRSNSDATLTPLPATLFNEPFHVKEWMSAWAKTEPRSYYLQTESLEASDKTAFQNVMTTHWLRSPYGPNGINEKAPSDTDRDQVIGEWFAQWERPDSDQPLHDQTIPGARGMFFGHVWDSVKLVIFMACNTHAWTKNHFNKIFPNALVLGYIGKNPANATPHVTQFLSNVYKNVSGPRDPKLLDHDYLEEAWMNLHHKNKMYRAERIASLRPSGKVYGVGPNRSTIYIGEAEQVMINSGEGTYVIGDKVFGYRGSVNPPEFLEG